MKRRGLTREQVERMTPDELRSHVDGLGALEVVETEMLGEEERRRAELAERRRRLLGRTKGRR